MKAIYTHYVGPTDRKPARIIASDMDGNRVTVASDSGSLGYNRDESHRRAAEALCQKMGWSGGETLIGGSLKHGMAWVFLPAAGKE